MQYTNIKLYYFFYYSVIHIVNKPSHKMFSICIEHNEIPSVAKCIDCNVSCLSLRTDVKNSEIEIK